MITKEEFIADYCRKAGVAWTDISKYRVVVPSNDLAGPGWIVVSVDTYEGDLTSQAPLETPTDRRGE